VPSLTQGIEFPNLESYELIPGVMRL